MSNPQKSPSPPTNRPKSSTREEELPTHVKMPYKGALIDLWRVEQSLAWWVTSTSLTEVFDLGLSKGRPRTLRSGLRGIDTEEGQELYRVDLRLGVLRSGSEDPLFDRDKWVSQHPDLKVGSAEMVCQAVTVDKIVQDYMRRRDKETQLECAREFAEAARDFIQKRCLDLRYVYPEKPAEPETEPFVSEPDAEEADPAPFPVELADGLRVVLDRGAVVYKDLTSLLLRERDLLWRSVETLSAKVSALEQTTEHLSDHLPQVPEAPERKALSWRKEITDWIRGYAAFCCENVQADPDTQRVFKRRHGEVNDRMRARGLPPVKTWREMVYRGLWRWFFGKSGPIFAATGLDLYELNRIDKSKRPSRARTVFDYIESRDDAKGLKDTVRSYAHATFVEREDVYLDTLPSFWLLF